MKVRGVMGLIEKDDKFLFGVENKKGKRFGKWRLLGGKLDGDENSTEAMIRESFEEANVKINVEGFLGEISGDSGENGIIVDMCYCKWLSGIPKASPREIGELKWFTLEEAEKLDKDRISEKALSLFIKK